MPNASASATPDATAPAPSSSPTWPRCGVLTEQGYHGEGELTFLVPRAVGKPEVQRYVVTDATEQAAPLSVYAGWWLCITDGTVKEEPREEAGEPRPGRIEIKDFSIDQSTGERGQE